MKYSIYKWIFLGSLPLSSNMTQAEPTMPNDSIKPQIIREFHCEGDGCPSSEELQKMFGCNSPNSSITLKNSRIHIKVEVKGTIQTNPDNECANIISGITTRR